MQSRSQKGASTALILLIIAGVAALLVGAYVGAGVFADELAKGLPDASEVRYFGDMGEHNPGWSTAPSTPAKKKAARVFALLTKAPGLRALSYRLYFVKEPLPNAFSLPGGAIGVTDGLLAMVGSENGLAMVLGHELGHQQYRHSLRMMGRTVLLGGISSLFFGGAGKSVVSAAFGFAVSSHSRKQELEADAYGLTMVYDVVGNTKNALEFFEKLEKDPKLKDNELSAMISTHPYTPDRIKQLKALQQGLNARIKPAPLPHED